MSSMDRSIGEPNRRVSRRRVAVWPPIVVALLAIAGCLLPNAAANAQGSSDDGEGSAPMFADAVDLEPLGGAA
ncbi:MAG: hypothetical protein ACO38W_03885, partial [Phycisphaerales bacterium]